MPLGHEYTFGPDSEKLGSAPHVRVRLKTFQIPPIRDAAVVGRAAALTPKAMGQALQLMSPEPFASLEIDDEKISTIFVREAILRKIGWDLVRDIVLEKVKPLMAESEILALQLDVDILISDT